MSLNRECSTFMKVGINNGINIFGAVTWVVAVLLVALVLRFVAYLVWYFVVAVALYYFVLYLKKDHKKKRMS